MTTFRTIDTAGLPAGFDVADLIDQGITGPALIAWCKARILPGPPPLVEKSPKKNPPAAEPSAGRGAGENRAEVTAQVKPKPTAAPASSTSAPASSNVADFASAAAARKPQVVVDLELGIPPEYSHDALADTFSATYADRLAYVASWGRWMAWEGQRWQFDETLQTRDWARTIARKVAGEASNRVDLGKKAASIANTLGSAGTVAAIETLARADRRHALSATHFDQDKWALNTPAGLVDLQTGIIRPGRKDDYCTKITRASPGGPCPRWLEFLKVATDGDDDLIAFMRRMAGYCITGETREHAIFFVYGTGGNGKGTFLNTLDWILNDYARVANMEMFVAQKYQSHPTDVAGLMGARMVTAQETEEGQRWHESRLKAFTGGDPITARFMRQDEFTFMPQFKLVFAGNHKPSLRNVDEAIMRRLYLIPFTVTVPPAARDPSLSRKLREEAGGILQWCIDGCLDWQNSMLAPPDRVLATTAEYFQQEDQMGMFIDECCEFDRNYSVPTSHLYGRYQRWAESAGEFVLPRKRWLQQMVHRNVDSFKRAGTMMMEGVRIKADPLQFSGDPRDRD
jgi:P4 family phage/plasmid primase-like protien